MSTLNPPKSISRRQELRQDRVVTVYARAVDFYHSNKTVVYLALAGVAALILAIVAYALLQDRNAEEAQQLLGAIEPSYAQGEYRAALDGTEAAVGLLEIAEEYGGTDAGNLAKFYAADALFRLGEYDQALEYFEAFDVDDNIVGASALAGRAAIYEIREEHERAGDLYREAALLYENEATAPAYLLEAGRAYEAAGDHDEAIEVYELLKDTYPDAPEMRDVDMLLARAQAAMQ